ncbi:hypothetical protein NL676_027283 [Syzygium grande]|nr:hypothetical protein NL676_027283 [Syzygium grande]
MSRSRDVGSSSREARRYETRKAFFPTEPPPSLSDRRRCFLSHREMQGGRHGGPRRYFAGHPRYKRACRRRACRAFTAAMPVDPARRTDPLPGAAGRGHPLLGWGWGVCQVHGEIEIEAEVSFSQVARQVVVQKDGKKKCAVAYFSPGKSSSDCDRFVSALLISGRSQSALVKYAR